MRTAFSIFILFIATLSFSQTRNFSVNVNIDVTPDKIMITLNSQKEDLNRCSAQVIDSAKNILKRTKFPKATAKQMMKQFTEVTIPIGDLMPGDYTCIIYIGKDELYIRKFFKDAIFTEPTPEVKPKN
jgi:hypothetical protein